MDENTRKKFELAAQVAGASRYPETGPWEYFYVRASQSADSDGLDFTEWSALDDDGDALRLAARLNMSLNIDHYRGEVDVSVRDDDGSTLGSLHIAIGADLAMSLRVAILEAAALYQAAMNARADR